MHCFGGSSNWSMVRRIACLLCFGFLVALALQQGVVMNFEDQGATTINSFSSNSSPLPLEKNFQAPELKGRTMGPKNFDTFRDAKRRVPNGPDPIHNRRASKSGRAPGLQ